MMRRNSKLYLWALALICVVAFHLRATGIRWPSYHPDEPKIASWIEWTYDHKYIEERIYANGFFVMLRPFETGLKAWFRVKSVAGFIRSKTSSIERRPLFDWMPPVTVARWFNVWLGTFTCLAVFLLASRVTGMRWAGVFAAALFATTQFAVEHAHYGETDIAMLFTLTVALWLLSVAADSSRYPALLLAALTSGFAAGTKFQLVILLIPLAVFAIQRTGWPVTGKAAGRGFAALLFSLVLFAAGFAVANPAVFKWSWFIGGLTHEAGRVYNEPGVAARQVKALAHGRELLQYASSLGLGWLALALTGIPIALYRNYRRYWPVLLLMPAVYLYYWLVAAPWVRSQEFMCFLPALATLAAITLAAFWDAARPIARSSCLAIAAAAIAITAFKGFAVMSVFNWSDTRELARHWLQQRIPTNTVIAAENYSEPALPDTGSEPVPAYKIEREGLTYVRSTGATYLLRTATIDGRGLRNPVSGALYPPYQENFRTFRKKSELLASFATLPPHAITTFASPTIEIYGLAAFAPTNVLNIELSQPVLLRSRSDRSSRLTYFSVGHKLGPAEAIFLSRKPAVFAIGGPGSSPRNVYAILSSGQRATRVRIDAFGGRYSASLDPYDVQVVRMTNPTLRVSANLFETIKARTVADHGDTPALCQMRIVFTLAEAAQACADLNRYDAISRLLSRDGRDAELDPVLHYIYAVRTAQWKLADQLRPGAIAAAGILEDCIAAPPQTTRINGNSGFYYDQFARIHLTGPGGNLPDELSVEMPGPVTRKTLTGSITMSSSRLQLPVMLAKGVYELHMDARFEPSDAGTNVAQVLEILHRSDEPGCAQIDSSSNEWQKVVLHVLAGGSSTTTLNLAALGAGTATFRNVELRWSLKSALTARYCELEAAMAEHDMHSGESAAAMQKFDELRAMPDCWNTLDVRRGRFGILWAAGETNAALSKATLDLMECAPNTYDCVRAIARLHDRPAHKLLDANIGVPVSFSRFFKLVGFSFDPATRKARCVFEATEDHLPLLSVALLESKRDDWRARQFEYINDGLVLSRGERVVADVRLSDSFACPLDPSRLALGLVTCRNQSAGSIPLAGSAQHAIPFRLLLTLAK